MSIRRPGWPTCWPGSLGTRPAGSTSSCRGTGGHVRSLTVEQPDMAAIAAVFTIGHVARMLGEDEDWLHDLPIDMFPEDGCLPVCGVGGDGGAPFTQSGIECLKQITPDKRAASNVPPPAKPTE